MNPTKIPIAFAILDSYCFFQNEIMRCQIGTSKQLISHYIANMLKENELNEILVVKQYLTTAADGKNYNVVFYSLEMIIAA